MLCLALRFELYDFHSAEKEKWLTSALKPLPPNFSVKEFGKNPEYSDWFGKSGTPSIVHSYLGLALQGRRFGATDDEKVAAAMKVFP